jgi:hypothetical protein
VGLQHTLGRLNATAPPGHRHTCSRPVGRTRTQSQAAADTTADRPEAARLWPGVTAVPDRVRPRPHELACLRWLPQGPPVSTLVAGVRSAAGHPSGPHTVADAGMAIDTSPAMSAGHQPSGGRSFRKRRTVNPPIDPARHNFLYRARPAQAGFSRNRTQRALLLLPHPLPYRARHQAVDWIHE